MDSCSSSDCAGVRTSAGVLKQKACLSHQGDSFYVSSSVAANARARVSRNIEKSQRAVALLNEPSVRDKKEAGTGGWREHRRHRPRQQGIHDTNLPRLELLWGNKRDKITSYLERTAAVKFNMVVYKINIVVTRTGTRDLFFFRFLPFPEEKKKLQ